MPDAEGCHFEVDHPCPARRWVQMVQNREAEVVVEHWAAIFLHAETKRFCSCLSGISIHHASDSI